MKNNEHKSLMHKRNKIFIELNILWWLEGGKDEEEWSMFLKIRLESNNQREKRA